MTRVLVVEDDDHVQTMLRMTLEDAGYGTEVAGDGSEALKLLRERTVDLVITDILMPGMEGLETIIEIRKSWPSLPVIAISGGGRCPANGYLEMAGEFGADRAFVKPVDRSELLKAISDLTPTTGGKRLISR
jgi:CheY-like chemotaxis protein